MKMLLYLIDYFAFTIVEGDWLNDTLTYLPEAMRPHLIVMGQALAVIFEGLYQ